MQTTENRQTPEDRIRALVWDLKPVRPIPSLRAGLTAAATPWLGLLFVLWSTGRLALRPSSHSDWTDPSFLVVLIGLAFLAIGSTGAALASVVPGRERATRIGLGIGGLGILLAAASEQLWIRPSDLLLSRADLEACLACLSHATGLGILSALMTSIFIGYGFMRRPSASAALAVVGGVSLGAIIVHASCAATSHAHLLVSHALAPAIAAAVMTLPISLVLHRSAERMRSGARAVESATDRSD